MNNIKFNKELYTSVICCLFPILLIMFAKGYNYGAILLLFSSLYFISSSYSQYNIKIIKHVSITYFFYFGIYVLSVIFRNDEISDLDQISRFILAIPILWMISHNRINKKYWILSIILSSLVAGLSASYQVYYLNLERAFSGNSPSIFFKGAMPIQLGNIAITLGLMCIPIAIYFLRKKNTFIALLAITASISGILASLLSGSRGGWIVLPSIIVYLLLVNRKYINRKYRYIIFTISTLATTTLLCIPMVKNRIFQAYDEIIQFYNNSDTFTSVGIRFELWKSSWLTFLQHPLFGASEIGRQELHRQWAEMGYISEKIGKLVTHSHNQYLDNLSVYGLIGLIALLCLFFVPAKIFISVRKNTSSELDKTICDLGIILILGMMHYSLTQVMFAHNSGTTFYAVMLAILIGMTSNMKELKP
ncbi:MAG: O-antigen ligase family protein [Vibrio sp.]|uniref:O-antigen ligase family protein n=1 Tax=Vibrio sp. TaxID=678 RepID=UPI003A882B8B